MSRQGILKLALASVGAVALFALFVYLDDNYSARDRQYSLPDIIAYLLLFKVAFFSVPKLEMKVARLEKQIAETPAPGNQTPSQD